MSTFIRLFARGNYRTRRETQNEYKRTPGPTEAYLSVVALPSGIPREINSARSRGSRDGRRTHAFARVTSAARRDAYAEVQDYTVGRVAAAERLA